MDNSKNKIGNASEYEEKFWSLLKKSEKLKDAFKEAKYDWNKIEDRQLQREIMSIDKVLRNFDIGSEDLEMLAKKNFDEIFWHFLNQKKELKKRFKEANYNWEKLEEKDAVMCRAINTFAKYLVQSTPIELSDEDVQLLPHDEVKDKPPQLGWRQDPVMRRVMEIVMKGVEESEQEEGKSQSQGIGGKEKKEADDDQDHRKVMSFEDLATELNKKNISLKKVLDSQIGEMLRWELLKPDETQSYRDRFRYITVSDDVLERISDEADVILVDEALNEDDVYKKIIVDAGIPSYTKKNGAIREEKISSGIRLAVHSKDRSGKKTMGSLTELAFRIRHEVDEISKRATSEKSGLFARIARVGKKGNGEGWKGISESERYGLFRNKNLMQELSRHFTVIDGEGRENVSVELKERNGQYTFLREDKNNNNKDANT